MDLKTFRDSLLEAHAPKGLSNALVGLWLDAKGDWDAAHRAVQAEGKGNATWVHAYLHRKEGDLSNAAHWYTKTNKLAPDVSLAEEWETIAVCLLEES
jgi:hypothetical protein